MTRPIQSLRITFVMVLSFLSLGLKAQIADTILDRGNLKFYESDTVYKFKGSLSYDLIDSLVQRVKDEDGKFKDGNLIGNEDYELSGLVFIPKWDYHMISPDTGVFVTVGYRVAVALWKSVEDCINPSFDAMILAGFGDINNALDPVSANYKNRLDTFTLELDSLFSATSGGFDLERNKYQGADSVRIRNNTRESDFVYLEYSRFDRLARGTNFFAGNQRSSEGIIFERARVTYDVKPNASASTNSSRMLTSSFDERTFRTLSFRPEPEPGLQSVPSRAAIAFEEGPRCPPFWDENDSGSRSATQMNTAAARTLSLNLMKDCIDDGEEDPGVCISVHIGGSTPTSSTKIQSGGVVFELDAEFSLSANLSVEALAGTYPHVVDTRPIRTLGLSLLLRQYFPFSPTPPGRTPGNAVFLSAGPGVFNLENQIKYGVYGGVGYRQRISPRINAEVAAQYLGLDRISGPGDSNLFVFKGGLKYCLGQN